MTEALDALFVAVDGGPRETLRPLAEHCGGALEDSVAATDEAHWARVIARRRPELLIVGTSDSDAGRAIEASARRGARAAKLPIVAIEDFPGNYAPVREAEADLVVVESAPAREIYVGRLGATAPPALVASPARYDAYRRDLANVRAATATRWQSAAAAGPTVLWAGQPESDDALRTLEALAPVLKRQGATLLFKAHPRDPGYSAGRYHVLFAAAGLDYVDATPQTVRAALAAAPRLVATQFSSVAIDAGFHGIPALCVLLRRAGGARLVQKKGYAVPPFCAADALALCTSAADLDATFTTVLCDGARRAALIRAFDAYFDAHTLATPALIDRLREFVRKPS